MRLDRPDSARGDEVSDSFLRLFDLQKSGVQAAELLKVAAKLYSTGCGAAGGKRLGGRMETQRAGAYGKINVPEAMWLGDTTTCRDPFLN